MADSKDTQLEELKLQFDAVTEQIGQLTNEVAHYTDIVKNVSTKLEKNKNEQTKIYEKYSDLTKKVYGKSTEENVIPSTIKELNEILRDFNKQKKDSSNDTEKSLLDAKIVSIKADIESIRALNAENRQLNSEKRNANDAIKSSNEEIKRLRESLLKINESQDKHLASIDKTNINIDKNVGKIDDIIEKLQSIYDSMPNGKHEEENVSEGNGGQDYDDDYKERLDSLEQESEIVDDLKKDFKDLVDIIETKNEALEDENTLLDNEEDKLEGAVSKFKEMHDEADDISDSLKDGQETLSKTKMPGSDGGSKSKGSFFNFLGDVLDTLYDFTLGFNDKWNEIEDHSRKFGRNLGMTAQQMRSYQLMLMSNDYANLINDLNMTGDELRALQTGFNDASNSAVILTNKSLEAVAATSKFVGNDTSMAMAENFRELGGSIEDSQAYLATTMERAKATGLNMAKHSKNFADNIKLASKYSFKNGLADISKMTALTDRWKVNLGSFAEGLSSSFKDIETSIDTSAKLQVLGGPMAAMFGNPLEMMNMVKTDMGSVIERFRDTIKDAGTFNEKTGVVEISAFNRDTFMEVAKALGLNFDEVLNGINAEAKARDIDNKLQVGGLNDVEKEFLYNMAQMKNGEWTVTTLDDNGLLKETKLSAITSKQMLDELRASQVGEAGLQSDVRAIRNKLLGKTEGEARNKDMSSYIEGAAAFKDAVQTMGAGALDPAEQMKLSLLYLMKGKLDKIGEIFAKVKDFLGPVITKIKNILTTIFGVVNSVFGDGGAGLVASAATAFGLYYAVRHPVRTLKAIPKWYSKAKKGISAVGRFGRATKNFVTHPQQATRAAWNSRFSNNIGKVQKAGAYYASRGNTAGFERAAAREAKLLGKTTNVGGSTVNSTTTSVVNNAATTGKNGLGSTFKNSAGQMLKGASGKALGGGIGAALIEVPMAMYETSQRDKEYLEEVKTINQEYGDFGKNNLMDRMNNNGQSFYDEAEKRIAVSDADRRRDNDNTETWARGGGAIAGAAVGAAAGSFIPVVGTIVGAGIGALAGIVLGEVGALVARATATKVSDEEVYGVEDMAQRSFELTKLGFEGIESEDDLFQRAAMATIGIHDLLISQDNEAHGLKWNGMTEEEFDAKKEEMSKEKKERYDSEHEKSWMQGAIDWVSDLFFADGGVVHASSGLKSVPSKHLAAAFASRFRNGSDTVPAMLTPNEMVINPQQQNNLWKTINTPYSSPTEILTNKNNYYNNSNNNSSIKFDPLSINLNGSLRIDTGFGNQGQITAQDLLRNSNFISTLANEITRYMDGMFNGGTFAGEHSKYKLDKV